MESMRLSAVDLQRLYLRQIWNRTLRSSVAISPAKKSVTAIFSGGGWVRWLVV